MDGKKNDNNNNIKRPQAGFQEHISASNVDVVFGGGILAGGKSYAILLAMAEPLLTDPNFRALISRKQQDSLKAAGGFVDKIKDIFGNLARIKESDNPRATFPNGSFIDMTYIDDGDMKRLTERAKGWEYDMITVDELTEMSFEAFMYIMTRNRGKSKTFTGKMFATMNPKRSHWARTFLDWYIGADGYIIPERDGCVRYFYVNGTDVKDVVWGNSKEEVYRKCKIDIDRKLKYIGGDFSYENMIKSFVFYKGSLAENKALTENNPDYVGSVAASGGKMAQALIEGNWNVDPEDSNEMPIPSIKAQECFTNDPAVNGDKWLTVDLADFGTDNMVALAWNGFHVFDIMIVSHSTPRENAIRVKQFAQKNEIADDHIIFDGTAGRYFNDYIPEAHAYLSSTRPIGLYKLSARTFKDLCYLRLVRMINAGHITFSEEVARKVYKHQNLKYVVTVQNEFLEECSVIGFDDVGSGKKSLWTKKRMNSKLGRGRSMDVVDPCAMRMWPCTSLEYGQELIAGFGEDDDALNDGANMDAYLQKDIYDATLWC